MLSTRRQQFRSEDCVCCLLCLLYFKYLFCSYLLVFLKMNSNSFQSLDQLFCWFSLAVEKDGIPSHIRSTRFDILKLIIYEGKKNHSQSKKIRKKFFKQTNKDNFFRLQIRMDCTKSAPRDIKYPSMWLSNTHAFITRDNNQIFVREDFIHVVLLEGLMKPLSRMVRNDSHSVPSISKLFNERESGRENTKSSPKFGVQLLPSDLGLAVATSAKEFFPKCFDGIVWRCLDHAPLLQPLFLDDFHLLVLHFYEFSQLSDPRHVLCYHSSHIEGNHSDLLARHLSFFVRETKYEIFSYVRFCTIF